MSVPGHFTHSAYVAAAREAAQRRFAFAKSLSIELDRLASRPSQQVAAERLRATLEDLVTADRSLIEAVRLADSGAAIAGEAYLKVERLLVLEE